MSPFKRLGNRSTEKLSTKSHTVEKFGGPDCNQKASPRTTILRCHHSGDTYSDYRYGMLKPSGRKERQLHRAETLYCLHFSLSLSLTHTHTHTQNQLSQILIAMFFCVTENSIVSLTNFRAPPRGGFWVD